MDFLLPAPVLRALDMLEEGGFSAYVVGGCVRDWVLGIPPHDFDICTAATPEEMKEIFKGERTIETGIKHGTLTVLMENEPLEITTFRLDGDYLDGRHPSSVSFTRKVEEDLSRRDFTMNAMAYSPKDGLIDPFGGQKDCRDEIIRCVGEPERRFQEDALRILRALRFSARLGFPIEEATVRAIGRLKENLEKISKERIAVELTGLLQGRYAREILMDFAPVIVSVIPELAQADPVLWESMLSSLAHLPREPLYGWTALLNSCSTAPAVCADTARRILRNLKMPLKLIEGAGELIAWRDADLQPHRMQKMLMHLGPERLSQLLFWREAEKPGAYEKSRTRMEELLRENACYSLAQLAVNGKEMAALGLRGAQIGAALNMLLEQVVDGSLPNERQALIHYISRHAPCD
ncbi:MAG: CCA tRNA nucleotidyltransferase [Clostridiales bacterium]|nr:CCA tRNA nucleotidyltransferase [Clostridiales bacterium]